MFLLRGCISLSLLALALLAPPTLFGGVVVVHPGDPGWNSWGPNSDLLFVGITGANPRSGNGSLEYIVGVDCCAMHLDRVVERQGNLESLSGLDLQRALRARQTASTALSTRNGRRLQY